MLIIKTDKDNTGSDKGKVTRRQPPRLERLTEKCILVEMSAVNTNHPVVNAVLNQKVSFSKGQGTSMIFKVGDMGGMRLNEEETVILLSQSSGQCHS